MANSQVILTENIESLGAEADIISVRRGYARNYLIPRGKALEITASSLRQINHLKQKRAEREAHELATAQELGNKISKLKLVFELETGQSGKAFGSVTVKDITEKLLKELPSIVLPKHALSLDKPIKETGEKKIDIKLYPGVSAQLSLSVNAVKKEKAGEATPASAEELALKKSRKKSVDKKA